MQNKLSNSIRTDPYHPEMPECYMPSDLIAATVRFISVCSILSLNEHWNSSFIANLHSVMIYLYKNFRKSTGGE